MGKRLKKKAKIDNENSRETSNAYHINSERECPSFSGLGVNGKW